MARQKFFIRRPASKRWGIAEDYIEVDPEQLHLGMLTEIFTLETAPGGDRRHRYLPAHGLNHLIKTGVDVSSLVETWDGLRGMIELATVRDGIAGEFGSEIRGLLGDVPQLLELAAAGQLTEAGKVLEAIAYRLLAATGTATTKLVELETKLNAQGNLAESMVGIVVNAEERHLNEAIEFTEAVTQGLAAHAALAAYEQELETLFERLEPKHREWLELSASDTPGSWLASQLDWLTDLQHGFTTRASRFMIDPDSESEESMMAAVTEATERIASIRRRMSGAAVEHQQARTDIDAQLGRESEVDPHIRTLRASREIVERGCKTGIDAFAVQSELVTAEQFGTWQGLLVDRQWSSLHDIGTRFRYLAESLRRTVDSTPRLDGATERAIASAESYIERLEARLTEPTPPAEDVAAPPLQPAPPQEPGESLVVDLREHAAAAQATREEELQELILAVAAIKYCGTAKRPTLMTLNSVLKILEEMGRTTREDRECYSKSLQEWINSHSWNEELEPKRFKRRTDAWLQLTPDEAWWITFRQGRGGRDKLFWYWRLTDQLRERGLQLADKHGITETDVQAAYLVVKAARPGARTSS